MRKNKNVNLTNLGFTVRDLEEFEKRPEFLELIAAIKNLCEVFDKMGSGSEFWYMQLATLVAKHATFYKFEDVRALLSDAAGAKLALGLLQDSLPGFQVPSKNT